MADNTPPANRYYRVASGAPYFTAEWLAEVDIDPWHAGRYRARLIHFGGISGADTDDLSWEDAVARADSWARRPKTPPDPRVARYLAERSAGPAFVRVPGESDVQLRKRIALGFPAIDC